MPARMSSVEHVTTELVGYLRGMTIFGHPHTQQNVVPPPTISSLIGVLLASCTIPISPGTNTVVWWLWLRPRQSA